MSLLDKEHAKSHKKMKTVVKKKSSAVEKLSKKAKKKAGDAELAEEHELKVSTHEEIEKVSHFFKLRDLTITGDVWVDRERAAVRDIQENRIIECEQR